MKEALELARAYGVAIEFADLGAWGPSMLYAEYDPSGPTIRVNRHAIERLSPREARAFAGRALAHELYHHREWIGEIPRGRSHDREPAAHAFANALYDERTQ
jgi:hypothetical protein